MDNINKKIQYKKMKKEHRQDTIVAFTLLCFTTVVFVVLSNVNNTNTIALIASMVAFFGGIFNLIYVLTNNEQKEKEFRKDEK